MVEALSSLVFLGIFDLFTNLLGLGNPLQDLTFALKIISLLVVIGYVRSHVYNPTLQMALLGVLAYFIFFQNWAVLGGVVVLYLVLSTGLFGVVTDFLFFLPHGDPMAGQHQETEQEGDHTEHGRQGHKKAAQVSHASFRQFSQNPGFQQLMHRRPGPPRGA